MCDTVLNDTCEHCADMELAQHQYAALEMHANVKSTLARIVMYFGSHCAPLFKGDVSALFLIPVHHESTKQH